MARTRSQKTENQILIKAGYEEKFFDFLETANPAYLAKCEMIYKHPDMTLYAFDFEGTPDKTVLWEKMMKNVPYVLETNYLDGKLPWTRDYTGGEWDKMFSWQISEGELFPEISAKYENQSEIFNDPIFKDSAINYSNQKEVDWQQVKKLVNLPYLDEISLN